MYIAGIQKLTLLDYPDKTACTIFTGGCNFRCPFCHNGSLVIPPLDPPVISQEEFFSFLSKRNGLLDGVCITGGEPLLQPDIEDFCKNIHDMGFLVKLDTNGSKPQYLDTLLKNGLVDYVAMDIKNSPTRYGETVGVENFDIAPIKESVNILMSSKNPFEFRTTAVIPFHSEKDFEEIGMWLKGTENYFIQVFRETENVIASGLESPSEEQLKQFLSAVSKYIPSAKLRGI